MSYQITRPDADQIKFTSEKTGNHVLDEYIQNAEKGTRTLGQMLADIFDDTGALRTLATPAQIASFLAQCQAWADLAASHFDSFDDRYLGVKTADPALDNDGNALLQGAMYFSSTTLNMRVYNGSAWENVTKQAAFYTQQLSGNASTTVFTLTSAPSSAASLEVYVAGVRKIPGVDYTVSGTTLTFTSAPPAGTNNVFCRWVQTVALGTADYAVSAGSASSATSAGSATQATKLLTTNFSLEEVSGVLYFKYGTTSIAKLESSGKFTALNDVASFTTP